MMNGTSQNAERYRAALEESAQFVQDHLGEVPQTVIVLGSGFASVAALMNRKRELPFSEIPRFPVPTTPAHRPVLSSVEIRDKTCILLEGRVHLYEGFSAMEVAIPVRVLALAGSTRFLLTNAAGAIHPDLGVGELMLIRDHINLTGTNPLKGCGAGLFGELFVDMNEAYDSGFRQEAKVCAKSLGISLREGVYAAVPGPCFETPAEVQMLRSMGADAVGMSTIPEVIALRQMKKMVGAVSCLTNKAAGISRSRLSHEEVVEVVARQRRTIGRFLAALVARL